VTCRLSTIGAGSLPGHRTGHDRPGSAPRQQSLLICEQIIPYRPTWGGANSALVRALRACPFKASRTLTGLHELASGLPRSGRTYAQRSRCLLSRNTAIVEFWQYSTIWLDT